MESSKVLKELTKGVYLLSDNRILNTNTQKIYSSEYLWLIEENRTSITIGDKIIKVARSFNDTMHDKDTRLILFVYCWDIFSKKKLKFAELHDNYGKIEYPIEGSKYINESWIEFNYKFQPKKAYILLLRCDPEYPQGFEIVSLKLIK